jgi:hypothetical protein
VSHAVKILAEAFSLLEGPNGFREDAGFAMGERNDNQGERR